MLEHGGRLRAAAAQWGIALEDWLDLSTGIAPVAYPVPALPSACWQRLPEDDDGLEAAARACYGASSLLVVPGSQAAIMALPRLRPAGSAAVLTPGYGEYAAAWRAAGHALQPFAATDLEAVAASADAVVLGNPNNPDGTRFSRQRLLAAAQTLAARDGWLVVDEAFADAEPGAALCAVAGSAAAPNLIVLRSLGKFFGLAGARVGCVVAASALLERLREIIGPWAVSHPARAVAQAALADSAWQAAQRQRLEAGAARLTQLLAAADFGATAGATAGTAAGTALFRYVSTPRAGAIFAALARRGILVRRFDAPAALRFGLPGDAAEWSRLAAALASLKELP